jgi:hypothetical protein
MVLHNRIGMLLKRAAEYLSGLLDDTGEWDHIDNAVEPACYRMLKREGE